MPFLPVEIGIERETYNGREIDQMTEEICVVIFADPNDFANETLESVFFDIGISTITALITPTADANSTATGKIFHTCIVCSTSIAIPHFLVPTYIHSNTIPLIRTPSHEDSYLSAHLTVHYIPRNPETSLKSSVPMVSGLQRF